MKATITDLTDVDVVLTASIGGTQVTVVAEGGLDVDGLDTLMEMLEVVRSAVPSGCPLCGEDITGPVTWVKSEDAEATWVMVHPECAERQKELNARAARLAAKEVELDSKLQFLQAKITAAGVDEREPKPDGGYVCVGGDGSLITADTARDLVDRVCKELGGESRLAHGLDIHVEGRYEGPDGEVREVLNLIESEAGDGPTVHQVRYKILACRLPHRVGERRLTGLEEFVRWMGSVAETDELDLEDEVCRPSTGSGCSEEGTGDEAPEEPQSKYVQGVEEPLTKPRLPYLCSYCFSPVTGIEPDDDGQVWHSACVPPEPEAQDAGGTVSMGQDEAAEVVKPTEGLSPGSIRKGARYTDGERVREVMEISGRIKALQTVEWQGVYPDGSRRMGKVYTWTRGEFAAWAQKVFVPPGKPALRPAQDARDEKPEAAAEVVSKKAEKVGASPERVKKPAKSEQGPKPAAPLRELDGESAMTAPPPAPYPPAETVLSVDQVHDEWGYVNKAGEKVTVLTRRSGDVGTEVQVEDAAGETMWVSLSRFVTDHQLVAGCFYPVKA